MHAVAAPEAAWADDNDAIRLQNMLLIVTGIAGLDGADQQKAIAEFRQGLTSHMTAVALNMMSGWALTAGEDVQATGDLAATSCRQSCPSPLTATTRRKCAPCLPTCEQTP
ncbi:hypothetical protein [Streptomyces alanosinicus]|uniref:Uncharacterized protein n=1 Tax=Streptomyces alanosinicus TaxID=68171 RepID=A0A918MH70_9ACTN|nr:hypothetical protein [Streptomyces alanosinicus]GGW25090.1 hypothetical protein GCM10010339_94680 [Streptomyces alanosinicus]